ncbi:MAG: chromate transporter [Firmicutes bacterium]|nr:chromate transporter [Bacillota bacterium]
MNIMLEMFLTFAKIGAVTFGGGYAMLPILEREIVEKHKWATSQELLDYFAIGQCTPGVIAVNTATFIGYRNKGIIGGITTTLAVVTPSVVIITIIALFIQNFLEYEAVQYALTGIRICVCVMIFNAVAKMMKSAVVDKITLVIFITVLICALFLDVSTVLFVVLAAFVGIAVKSITEKGGDKK